MDNFIEMTFEEADEQFKFIPNQYDEFASFDGLMYETYGDEVEAVKAFDPAKIWMYGDGDNGNTYIWSGWGFVNRIGYFLSENPVPDNTTIQIKVSDYWYYCEGCGEEMEDDGQQINDKFYDFQCCPLCATVEQLKEIEEINVNVG
jgi:hypothetical protein